MAVAAKGVFTEEAARGMLEELRRLLPVVIEVVTEEDLRALRPFGEVALCSFGGARWLVSLPSAEGGGVVISLQFQELSGARREAMLFGTSNEDGSPLTVANLKRAMSLPA